MPPLSESADLECVLDQLQGFMLVGGPDLDPRRDGFILHGAVRAMEPRRETFDRMLMDSIADAACLVRDRRRLSAAEYFPGGNLYLHIPEDLPTAIPHKDPQDPAHRHGLTVVPSRSWIGFTGMAKFASTACIIWRSTSWRGVSRDGAFPDGVIEAIESTREDGSRWEHSSILRRRRHRAGRADLRGVCGWSKGARWRTTDGGLSSRLRVCVLRTRNPAPQRPGSSFLQLPTPPAWADKKSSWIVGNVLRATCRFRAIGFR